ncbi:MAG: hypothetical protein R2882_11260 [Gemmatimonadales bacterium]
MREVVAASALLLAACGGTSAPTSPPPPPPPPPPGTFSVSVGPVTPTSVERGTSGTATITVARSGSFSGAVALSVEGAPSGATVTLNPAAIPSGSTTSNVTIDVGAGVNPGTYPLTVRGQASGISDQTAALSLVIVDPPPVISLLRATNAPLSTNAGGAPITFDIIVLKSNYSADVKLSVLSGLPAGVTAAFAPDSLSAGDSRVTLTVDATAAPGSYTAELRGTGTTGGVIGSLSVPFSIIGPGAVTVTTIPAAIATPQNSTDAISIVLTRTNYTGGVTLDAVGLPAGVTVKWGQNPLFSNNTTVTFTVGPTVPVGNHAITITASAPGITGGSTGLTLTVTASGGSGNTTVRFCGAPEDIPIWFGYSTNGVNWTRVAISPDNSFVFDFPTRGFLVWVTQHGPDDFRTNLYAGSSAEIAVIAAGQCSSPTGRTASGTVAGLTAANQAQVAFGPRSPSPAPTFAAPAFQLTDLPDGPLDLLGARLALDLGTGSLLADRVLVQRGLDPVPGGSVGTLDFGGAGAITPESKTLTVTGVAGGESLTLASFFRSAGGASVSLGTAVVTGAAGPVRHLPAANVQAGDYHQWLASASVTGAGGSFSRTVAMLQAAPADGSLALGADPGPPTVIVAELDDDRIRFSTTIPEHPDYERLFIAGWYQQSGATRRDFTMTATERMAVNTPSGVRMRMPDLTGTPGWERIWESRPALEATWFASSTGWVAAAGVAAPIADGVVTRSATRTGTIVP